MTNTGHITCASGPIARKVLALLDGQMNRRVIDFAELKLGAERAKELEKGVITEEGMKDLDPLHAVYAYAHLLKYGLISNYWNEYVFESYVNHRHNMIMLAGLPDIPRSRSHSRESHKRERT